MTYTDLLKLSGTLNKALAVPKHLVLPRQPSKSDMVALYGDLAWRANSGDDQMDALRYNIHGTLTGRFESRMRAVVDDLSWPTPRKFKSRRFKTIMHAFHHKQGYIEIQNASLPDAPNHSYVLWQGNWYKKVRAKQIERIKPNKVPSAHRLHLMIMHVDQPKG